MLKKIIPFLLLPILLLAGCASTPTAGSASGRGQPSWITDIDSAYPPSQYLAVLGEGDSLSKAQSKAAANMALIFESRIKVDTTIENRYADMRKQGVLTSVTDETRVTDKISQLSDQTLSNLKFGESWTNDMGTVIVAAYLNRVETAELYRKRIEDQSHVLLRLKDNGDNGNTKIEKYAYYDSAFVIAVSNEVLLEQLDILHPQMADTLNLGYSLDDLKTVRTRAAQDLTFRINFTGKDSTAIASAISDTFTDMGFSLASKAELMAEGSLISEKIERNNDYENFKWYLSLEIINENGLTIISIDESGISASTSESAARSRLNVDVQKVISRELPRQFNIYLNSFLDK
ncbi:MAG: LPP20 family lipoprotein [Spirochaetales bacterium]|nr:LPP20 family lipoprotein [Spirochaetales bacterium]